MRKRRVVARGEMPRDKLAGLAGNMSDGPLKDTLERIASDHAIKSTRSKT